jgi:uncharacterized Zn finger protein (UPF0148 family)
MTDEKVDTFECPRCGKPQTYFVKRGAGWTRCPGCDKGVKVKNVPSNLIREDPEFVSKRDTSKRAAHKSSTHEVGDDSPFDIDKEPYQLLDEVLRQFKVKDIARVTAVRRCKRHPLHPRELAETLENLDLGVKKSVIKFVVDEYFYALEGEKDRQSDDTKYYGSSERGPSESRYYGSSERGSGGSGERSAWDRQPSGAVTARDLERFFDDKIAKRDEEQAKTKELDEMKGMIGEMAGVVKDLQHTVKNPPRDDDRFFKMMEQQQEERIEQLKASSSDRETFIREIAKERAGHNKAILDFYKDKASESSRPSVDGYKDDGIRLLASTVDRVGTIIEKKEPVKILAASQRQTQPIDQNPVTRKKDGSVGILSELGDELIDDD